MAISVVQTQHNSGTSATLAVTLTGTTAGTTLIVAISTEPQSGGYASSVVTSGGQHLVAAIQAQDGSGEAGGEIWYLDGITGGQTSVTITWPTAPGSGGLAVVYEVSGLGGSGGSLDQSSAGANSGSSPTAFNSGTTPTLSQASEIAVGVAGIFGFNSTVTGPSSPWTNAGTIKQGSFTAIYAGYNIVSSTTGLAYSGSFTHTGTGYVAPVIATFKAASGKTLSLPVAQVNIAAPAPASSTALALAKAAVTIAALVPSVHAGVGLPVAGVTIAAHPPGIQAGPVALPKAAVTIAAPVPGARVSVALPAAQVTIAAHPVALPVFLPAAQVTIAAHPVAPTIGIVVALPVAGVTIAAHPPGVRAGPVALAVAGVTVAGHPPAVAAGPVALPVAQVTVAAHPPGVRAGPVALAKAAVTIAAPAPSVAYSANVTLPTAHVTITGHPPTPLIGIHVNLTTAKVTVAAHPVKLPRHLVIALASQAGQDDYGNNFVEGVSVGAATDTGQVEITPGTGGAASRVSFPVPPIPLSNVPNVAGGKASTSLANFLVSGPAIVGSSVDDWVQLVLFSNDDAGSAARMEFRYVQADGAGWIVTASYNSDWTFNSPVTFGNPVSVTDGITVNYMTSPNGQPVFGWSEDGNYPLNTSVEDDPNSGTTWVSGERAFMNDNWVTAINNNAALINYLYSVLQDAGIIAGG